MADTAQKATAEDKRSMKDRTIVHPLMQPLKGIKAQVTVNCSMAELARFTPQAREAFMLGVAKIAGAPEARAALADSTEVRA